MSTEKVERPRHKPAVSGADEIFERAAEVFRVMADPVRLKIVRCLCQGEKSVPRLVAETDVDGHDIAQHLRLLHAAGVIGTRSDGQDACYRVVNDLMRLSLPSCLQAEDRQGALGGSRLRRSDRHDEPAPQRTIHQRPFLVSQRRNHLTGEQHAESS